MPIRARRRLLEEDAARQFGQRIEIGALEEFVLQPSLVVDVDGNRYIDLTAGAVMA